jgi:uncharacterized membrane-anchored protein YhcB (DUF1043 family)
VGTPGIEIAVAIGIFAAGLAAGILLGRARGSSAERMRALESELREEREKSEAYQDSVAKHFGGTSDMFRDMTRQYATLYAHLAEGARDLCADRVPEIGQGFSDPSLQLIAAPPEDEAAEPQDAGAEAAEESPAAQASSA